MGPDAASVRRRSIDARRSGERAVCAWAENGSASPAPSPAPPHAALACHGVDPAHLALPGLDRLRQRLGLLVRDLFRSPPLPDGAGEPVQRRKGFRPADGGQ